MKQLMAAGVEQKLEALSMPGPADSFIRCYITRKQSMLSTHPTFEMFLEVGASSMAIDNCQLFVSM